VFLLFLLLFDLLLLVSTTITSSSSSALSLSLSLSLSLFHVYIVGVCMCVCVCVCAPVGNNGLNPMWNETFELTIANTEISIVTLCIMDDDKYSKDDFVAYWGSAAWSLREGVRSCRLRGANCKTIHDAHLLIKIEWA
jgi:phosphatidylinositol phospholipase C, gamma-1